MIKEIGKGRCGWERYEKHCLFVTGPSGECTEPDFHPVIEKAGVWGIPLVRF
jgi:hypothetical protein